MKNKFNKLGFTMMELLVIFILVAVLAQIAIVTYRRSVEDSNLDRAKVVLEEVATAVQRLQTDYPYVMVTHTSAVAKTTGTTGCIINRPSNPSNKVYIANSTVVTCGYLKNRDWDQQDFSFYLCSNANPGSNGTCCYKGKYLACMKGKASAGRYADKEYAYEENVGIKGIN
ncbi:Tfp pilus assembly protein PilE [Elusimicrobium simillimum]|uniref:type IV pilin protein n=1 Tax=Elusimicrobium simillimum TaxID=3143438 RepID=UPI003C6FC398